MEVQLLHAHCTEPAIPVPTTTSWWPTVVRMPDAKGGWKAADTALWREHLHAATMVGRVTSAQRAVELGYAIVADAGPSGPLTATFGKQPG